MTLLSNTSFHRRTEGAVSDSADNIWNRNVYREKYQKGVHEGLRVKYGPDTCLHAALDDHRPVAVYPKRGFVKGKGQVPIIHALEYPRLG